MATIEELKKRKREQMAEMAKKPRQEMVRPTSDRPSVARREMTPMEAGRKLEKLGPRYRLDPEAASRGVPVHQFEIDEALRQARGTPRSVEMAKSGGFDKGMPRPMSVQRQPLSGPQTRAERTRVGRSEYSKESSQLLKRTRTKGALDIKIKPPGPSKLTMGQRIGAFGKAVGKKMGMLGVAGVATEAIDWATWQAEQKRRRKAGYGPSEGGGQL